MIYVKLETYVLKERQNNLTRQTVLPLAVLTILLFAAAIASDVYSYDNGVYDAINGIAVVDTLSNGRLHITIIE